MSISAHYLLANMAEHKRNDEGDILIQLTEYRKTLAAAVLKLLHNNKALQQQSVIKMEAGTQAMELAMLNQSIQEQQQRIVETRFEMGELDKAIAQQREKWLNQHKKHVAHEAMHHQAAQQAKKAFEIKQQTYMDNQFVATMVANKARSR